MLNHASSPPLYKYLTSTDDVQKSIAGTQIHCMSTGEMSGHQISPKRDQNAKRSTFRKPLTELVLSKLPNSCRLEPIRDLWESESHQQSATLAETHHNATIYEKVDSVSGQEQKQSFEKT